MDIKGEMALWQAVIELAVKDVLTPRKNKDALLHKRLALAWFENNAYDSSFRYVCHLAGVNSNIIRNKFFKILKYK